jgi:multidrug efflux pump subunit AcrA (membrane-fusion protein)
MTTPQQIPLKAYETLYRANKNSKVKFWSLGIFLFLLIILFLPWTQNIRGNGDVTSMYQEQRQQNLNSPIPGKIVKWWVKEGDIVKKGDTILQLSEIKEDYLDPNLVNRTKQQIEAKKGTIEYYGSKAKTADVQSNALEQARIFKIEQLKNKKSQLENKLIGEKAELKGVENELINLADQYKRNQELYKEDLISLTQLQQRNVAYQNAIAKKQSIESKIAVTVQEITNNSIEQNGVEQEYTEKISKTQGDKFQSLSQVTTGAADVAKLENQVANYIIRNGMYILLAPQDGQIVQASKAGIGEILKEGEKIATIVPTKINYVVEMFVKPVDLPLISQGQKVRFMFDGFPAIVFSGWPNSSYGTFGGKIQSFENTISPNGKFRVIVAEDTTDKPWPPQLKLGTGAQGIALLKNVPIWYELWRNINGFPPDYYKKQNEPIDEKKK